MTAPKRITAKKAEKLTVAFEQWMNQAFETFDGTPDGEVNSVFRERCYAMHDQLVLTWAMAADREKASER